MKPRKEFMTVTELINTLLETANSNNIADMLDCRISFQGIPVHSIGFNKNTKVFTLSRYKKKGVK